MSNYRKSVSREIISFATFRMFHKWPNLEGFHGFSHLDVDSLFTNVPLDEAISIAISKVYGRKQKIDGIAKKEFRQMLITATQGSIFYFNGSFF